MLLRAQHTQSLTQHAFGGNLRTHVVAYDSRITGRSARTPVLTAMPTVLPTRGRAHTPRTGA